MRRLIKNIIFFAYVYCGYVQVRDLLLSLLGRSRAVVVYYHRIGPRDVLSKPASEFRRDLRYLRRHYECVSLAELCRRLRDEKPLRRRLVAVTFDDGYRDNYVEAAPVLLAEGVPAAFFVTTGFIGADRIFAHDARGEPPDSSEEFRFPKLTWEDLRVMQQAGFEIGAHTVNHVNLGHADENTARAEVTASVAALDRELGERPRAFSFPWGKPQDISLAALEAVRHARCYSAASAYGGYNSRGGAVYNIQRVDIGSGHLSHLAVRARIAGLDPDFWRLRLAGRLKPLAAMVAQVATPILLLACCGHADAGTLHVALTGNDANPGTEHRPLATPQAALNRAQAGDTIYLRGGRYALNRFLWMDKPGITLASFPGETATLAAETGEKNPMTVITVVADGVRLKGLDIQGSAYYGIYVNVNGEKGTRGVSIQRCRIRGTGRDGIKTLNADKLLIEDCRIGPTGVRDPSNAEGIDVIGSKTVIIRNCHVHDTATNGIYLKGGTRDGLIERCRIENTGKFAGILLGQDTDRQYMRDGAEHEAIDCIARDNLIVNAGAAGVGTYSGLNVRFENNTLVNVASHGQAAFWIVTNNRGVPCRDVAFHGNIVVSPGGRPFVLVKDADGPVSMDRNLYFSPAGRYAFWREQTTAKRFDAWDFEGWRRNMQVDSHSVIADPRLDEQDSYRPRADSPAAGQTGPVKGISWRKSPARPHAGAENAD